MSQDMNSLSDEEFLAQQFSFNSVEEEPETKEEVVEEAAESEEEEVNEESTEVETEEEESDTEQETSEEDVEDEQPEEVDSSLEDFKRILEPFKANGKEIKIDNVDEAIRLMQMGANYSNKMSALKPHRSIIKMLSENELMDSDKLSHVIDVFHKKDKTAIAKFLKDAEINPLDLDIESDGAGYKPNDYSVPTAMIDLEDTLDDIESMPKGREALSIVSSWDNNSKAVMTSDPQNLMIIQQHMVDGTYEKISNAVAKADTLNQLVGMNDAQKYQAVWQHLSTTGQLGTPNTLSTDKDTTVSTKDEEVRKQRKRSAKAPRRAPAKSVKEEVNTSLLSDEEFMKQFNPKY